MTDFQPPQPARRSPARRRARRTAPTRRRRSSRHARPCAPTSRTRDRKAGRFAVGVALGALVGASVAGGIVAVADHGDSTGAGRGRRRTVTPGRRRRPTRSPPS